MLPWWRREVPVALRWRSEAMLVDLHETLFFFFVWQIKLHFNTAWLTWVETKGKQHLQTCHWAQCLRLVKMAFPFKTPSLNTLADISRQHESQGPCGSYIMSCSVHWSYTRDRALQNLHPLVLLYKKKVPTRLWRTFLSYSAEAAIYKY